VDIIYSAISIKYRSQLPYAPIYYLIWLIAHGKYLKSVDGSKDYSSNFFVWEIIRSETINVNQSAGAIQGCIDSIETMHIKFLDKQ